MKKLFFAIYVIISISAVTAVGVFIGNGVFQNERLFDAIESDDYAAAKQAIEKGAWVNLRKHLLYLPNLIPTNPTPLVSACLKGNEEIVLLLLDNGADINKKCNYTDKTPLLAALHGGKANRFSLAMFLIENGADPFAEQRGTSPLQKTLFVSPYDDEQTIKEGFELFKYLVEQRQVDLVLRKEKENVLTYATHYRNYNVVEYLLKENYFDVDCKDLEGNTALIVAVANEEGEIVRLLLEFGADKSLKNSEGKTAYDYAVEQGFTELAELLKF